MDHLPIFSSWAPILAFHGLHHQFPFFSISFHTLAQGYFKNLTHTSYSLVILSPRSPSSVTCVISFEVKVYDFDIQWSKTINLFTLNPKTSFLTHFDHQNRLEPILKSESCIIKNPLHIQVHFSIYASLNIKYISWTL